MKEKKLPTRARIAKMLKRLEKAVRARKGARLVLSEIEYPFACDLFDLVLEGEFELSIAFRQRYDQLKGEISNDDPPSGAKSPRGGDPPASAIATPLSNTPPRATAIEIRKWCVS